MLQFAIPNKGALSDGAVQLLKAAGYKCTRYSRELIVSDSENGIDFVFLRPRDIATYVGRGIIDLGITGRDLAADSGAKVSELMPLCFGRSRFCFAAPKELDLTSVKELDKKRIACSYPQLHRKFHSTVKTHHRTIKSQFRQFGFEKLRIRTGDALFIKLFDGSQIELFGSGKAETGTSEIEGHEFCDFGTAVGGKISAGDPQIDDTVAHIDRHVAWAQKEKLHIVGMIGHDQLSAGTLTAESGFGEKFDSAFRESAFVGNSNLEHDESNS